MMSSWLIDKLDRDVIFKAALYKERVEVDVDGVRCELDVVCPDNVTAYLAVRALKDALTEVRAAGAALLSNAYRCGALHHRDEAVYRRAREVFSGVERLHYEPKHADEARELMAKELRRCVVCRIDVYTLFEKFVKCVKTSGEGYLFFLSDPTHLYSSSPADVLDKINRLLLARYRVVVDTDIDTFETLTKIYAKTSC